MTPMIGRFRRLAPALLGGLLLAGCSETSFMDTLGIGKSVPDERLVSTNPPLSVPPDMRLRPPSDVPAPRQQAARAAPPAALSAPGGAAAAPQTAAYSAAPDAPSTAGQPAAQNLDPRCGKPVSSFDKIYVKRGIAVYDRNCVHRKTVDLNRELAEKIEAEKKAKNPNYGTIFNIGNIFRD